MYIIEGGEGREGSGKRGGMDVRGDGNRKLRHVLGQFFLIIDPDIN